MGDFNADCSYLSKTKRRNLALRAEGYHWLIPDDWDTTVAASDCAYDRLEGKILLGIMQLQNQCF